MERRKIIEGKLPNKHLIDAIMIWKVLIKPNLKIKMKFDVENICHFYSHNGMIKYIWNMSVHCDLCFGRILSFHP